MNAYKWKRYIGVIVITIAAGLWEILFLLYKEKKIFNNIEEVTFSHESGFYEEDFELEIISSRVGEIYYTLDGSEPNRDSILYDSPIHITDVSVNDNVQSMYTNVSTGFLKERIEQYSPRVKYWDFTTPDYLVDKASVVRAVVYYDEEHHSDIQTATYFVGYSKKMGYDGMNVVSIVTSPDNLFGYEEGIYVTGMTYDEYWEGRTGRELVDKDNSWLWWSANYRNKGREWERKAECQFYDKNGNLFHSQVCGIRIHGGISRGINPKSLNLYSRIEYDGNEVFEADFFDNDYRPADIVLSQGGNDYRCKLSDYLVSGLIEGLAVASMDFEPYVMFLNGEYWGVYWLTDKFDEKFVSHYYDVAPNNIVMIKNGQLEVGNDDDMQLYHDMYEECSTIDMQNELNYRRVCGLIDMESYIDYYAIMLYIARIADWPNDNYALWRTRQTENGKYGDTKWRWMVFDLNSPGMLESYASLDTIEMAMEEDEMFKNMMSSDVFRQALFSRMEELNDTVFSFDEVNHKIDEYLLLMEEPLKINDKRFYGDISQQERYNQVESVRNFFKYRGENLEVMFDNYK